MPLRHSLAPRKPTGARAPTNNLWCTEPGLDLALARPNRRAYTLHGLRSPPVQTSGHRGADLDADVLTADASHPRDAETYDMGLISVLIGVLVIVVVGAICFWAIDKFANDRRLANLLKVLVVLICLGAILQRVLPLTY
jgi:hypothetical protein